MTVIPFLDPSKPDNVVSASFGAIAKQHRDQTLSFPPEIITATAVVYCEGNFGLIDGKTANGLVRHSEKYQILSVIDSTQAGIDSGEALGENSNGIPIFGNLAEALENAPIKPHYFIYGMAPATGMLSSAERKIILDALGLGMSVVNGLHEFLNDDPEFAAACSANNVEIIDIRRPPPKNELRLFSGNIHNVTCPRIK